MALTAITSQKQKLIVNNVVKACKDISKLNKTGYDFLYLSNGFIAHYDINGFIAHYNNSGFKSTYEIPDDLKDDILYNQESNQASNFRIGEENAEYYHSRRDTYNAIVEALGKG